MAAALPPAFSHNTFGTMANNQSRRPRRSSPDSEALASSEDEQEQQVIANRSPATAALQSSTARRPSWKLDSLPAPQRQPVYVGNQLSPGSTTSAEAPAWAQASTASMGRGSFSQGSFHWGGGGIWNNDAWKDSSQMMQSPTSLTSPGLTKATSPREAEGVPFPIPLQPNPKVYRSQSYSVGQLEAETAAAAAAAAAHPASRTRPTAGPGLHHRPSRPSMLSEISDGNVLGRVHEADEEQVPPSYRARLGSASLSKDTFPQDQQLKNRTSLGGLSAASGYSQKAPGSHRYLSAEPQDVDYAIEETDDLNELQSLGQRGLFDRRFSEAGAQGFAPNAYPENRHMDNVKRGHWHTAGYNGIEDANQSRRHSFAEVNVRHGSIGSAGSIGSVGDHQLLQQRDMGLGLVPGRPGPRYGDLQRSPSDTSYFPDPFRHELQYAQQQMHAQHRLATPPRNLPPPRPQSLHIVTFKCCRADVFYIQESTGLSVKPGDLVIVEADRGTDLGTVAQCEVSWAQAGEWKEWYAKEHWRWLMVFSRTGSTGARDPLSSSVGGAPGLMTPGMPLGINPNASPEPADVKPKMIKRHASAHEIAALREKEGNEAKAKRVCAQKVVEHNLNMEILDAEFQMDWKKLTFYYFADSYINFNSLVTDLFKIYKTRIWMSALNPASFAGGPSGIGPGAVGAGRDPLGGPGAHGPHGVPANYSVGAGAGAGSLGLVMQEREMERMRRGDDPNEFVFPDLNGGRPN